MASDQINRILERSYHFFRDLLVSITFKTFHSGVECKKMTLKCYIWVYFVKIIGQLILVQTRPDGFVFMRVAYHL